MFYTIVVRTWQNSDKSVHRESSRTARNISPWNSKCREKGNPREWIPAKWNSCRNINRYSNMFFYQMYLSCGYKWKNKNWICVWKLHRTIPCAIARTRKNVACRNTPRCQWRVGHLKNTQMHPQDATAYFCNWGTSQSLVHVDRYFSSFRI